MDGLDELRVVRQQLEDLFTRRDELFVALRGQRRPVPWEQLAEAAGMSRMGVIKAHNKRVAELEKQHEQPE
ncbi:hypothetical protein IU449_27190 [Nocardia higoensis]|uniref:Sigma-70-like protein n=1 Tax=Nocardia higoensis TaxID=228599 RepID=A0ABS0DIA9_9NOCA|nr:hypothetical protein [Nocardia higoensis]MBF6358186.1 hypothetical protein [Nocardia higoensis]